MLYDRTDARSVKSYEFLGYDACPLQLLEEVEPCGDLAGNF